MQWGFVKTICQMGTFMICAQAIIHFRPKATYEKYLKMLVSAMILIQILLSIEGVFTNKGQQQLADRATWFAENLEQAVQNAAENSLLSREDMQLILKGQNTPKEDTQVGQNEIESTAGNITVTIPPIQINSNSSIHVEYEK